MALGKIVISLCLLGMVAADTPANCTYEDFVGKWAFSIGEGGHDRTLNCSDFGPSGAQTTLYLDLLFPDLARDEYGNEGFWTIIYNQGFEVVISERKYFAFSLYKKTGTEVESICDKTFPGWTHDVMDRNWACFSGVQTIPHTPKVHKPPTPLLSLGMTEKYRVNKTLISEINRRQTSWKAVHYPQFDGMAMEDMIRMAGGRRSKVHSIPKPAPVTPEQIRLAQKLPEAFDWRDIDGVSYVSPIRNQGGCGSCYAFASMAMNEARVRILTNNTATPVFSPQDIVECSEYSQGCEGGFPYLIGGKYAEDFGIVQEVCNPYKGKDGACSTLTSCPRLYSTKYRYIGGFYGACNEVLMKEALIKNGPIAVSFEVYPDFPDYKSGFYHHTFLEEKFNPFELTNHVVLVVGYGWDKTDPSNPVPFWTVKNSWGPTWGEQGYFRIRRANDECAIESMAVESFPIL